MTRSIKLLSLSFMVLFITFTNVCIAQMVEQQGESSFGAFYALPVARFKSTDLAGGGGFAKPGWGLVFDSKTNLKILPGGLRLYSHGTYQWNNMDNQKVSEAFTETLGRRTVVSESRYSPILVTMGPAYDLDVTEAIKIGFNTGAGVLFNNTKAFTVTVFEQNNDEVLSEVVNFDNKPAFAYLFGIELKFMIVKDLLGISLYGDYTGSRQKTEFTLGSNDAVDSFQKLQYLNLGFKIAVKSQP